MDVECPICCEEDDVNIVQTECGHMFHEGCIERYIAYNNKKRLINCPVCRSIILENSENIETPSQLIQAPISYDDRNSKQMCMLFACMLLGLLMLLLLLLL